MNIKIQNIPNKAIVTWDTEVRAIIIALESYMLTNDEFNSIADSAINYSEAHFGQALIVDSSNAKGLLTPEQLDQMNQDIFASLSKSGIKYFISIKPIGSIFTELTVDRYSEMTEAHDLQLINVNSVEQGILWLKSPKKNSLIER